MADGLFQMSTQSNWYHLSTALQESREPERYIDPAMIGILAGMALMFIIICVVLRLFSR